MERGNRAVSGGLFLLLASVLLVSAATAVEPVRITKEELRARMSVPGIVVVDVRIGAGGIQSDRKITGSVREDPLHVNAWAPRYAKDQPIVLYCS
jgi:hypothetical protein